MDKRIYDKDNSPFMQESLTALNSILLAIRKDNPSLQLMAYITAMLNKKSIKLVHPAIIDNITDNKNKILYDGIINIIFVLNIYDAINTANMSILTKTL